MRPRLAALCCSLSWCIVSKDQDGTIDAAGFSFVGTPGVSVGQTDRVVWTPTTAFADVMDVWTVTMPDPDHVMLGGEMRPVTRREALITVRTPTSGRRGYGPSRRGPHRPGLRRDSADVTGPDSAGRPG